MNPTNPATRKLHFPALAALLLLSVAAAPTVVFAADSSMSATDTSKMDARVDTRITELHTKLGITADQESKWKDVTDVMHENAATMRPLIEARKAKGESMTAVDDLESYAKIADAHADGAKKFASVFKPLYDSMSDAQKKTADTMFRKHGHEMGHHHAKKAAAEATTP